VRRSCAHVLLVSGLLGGLFSTMGGEEAAAQTKLDARYSASLAGLPIGRGSWVVTVTDDQFTASASGATAGLMRMFSSGRGTTVARGWLSGGHFVSSDYATAIITDKRTDEVKMSVAGGTLKETTVIPPVPKDPDRVPLTDAHRRGVIDPMTAAVMRVPGNGDMAGAEACQRTLKIFDGRVRYDLTFRFKRTEKVKAEKGYEGQAAVCGVSFQPIAGHVPDRSAIKWLREQTDIEVWLVPIAGTRVLVPFKMQIPTPIGMGLLQATQFVTGPASATASAKTQ